MKLQVIMIITIITLSSWGLVMAQGKIHKTSNEGIQCFENSRNETLYLKRT